MQGCGRLKLLPKSLEWGAVHRLNMELDLHKFIWTHVHSCTHWLRPRDPATPPLIWAYTRERYWSAKIDDISL